MAEGYLKHFAGETADTYSAGIQAHGLNKTSFFFTNKRRKTISHQTSNLVADYKNISFDFIITVCDNAKENCPYFPSDGVRLHCNFLDPAKASGTDVDIFNAFRSVRDQIKHYCRGFVNEYIIQDA